jgi:hypothetical protein
LRANIDKHFLLKGCKQFPEIDVSLKQMLDKTRYGECIVIDAADHDRVSKCNWLRDYKIALLALPLAASLRLFSSREYV